MRKRCRRARRALDAARRAEQDKQLVTQARFSVNSNNPEHPKA
jgi:hypothetical protein